jgi:hypothetical protein
VSRSYSDSSRQVPILRVSVSAPFSFRKFCIHKLWTKYDAKNDVIITVLKVAYKHIFAFFGQRPQVHLLLSPQLFLSRTQPC